MSRDENAVRDFLGERPGAGQLAEWRVTLQQRLQSMEADQKKAPTPALEAKIAQLKRQITALAEEEAVTQFVEDSVRVTLAMGTGAEGMDESEE
jgi:hypothetical protein